MKNLPNGNRKTYGGAWVDQYGRGVAKQQKKQAVQAAAAAKSGEVHGGKPSEERKAVEVSITPPSNKTKKFKALEKASFRTYQVVKDFRALVKEIEAFPNGPEDDKIQFTRLSAKEEIDVENLPQGEQNLVRLDFVENNIRKASTKLNDITRRLSLHQNTKGDLDDEHFEYIEQSIGIITAVRHWISQMRDTSLELRDQKNGQKAYRMRVGSGKTDVEEKFVKGFIDTPILTALNLSKNGLATLVRNGAQTRKTIKAEIARVDNLLEDFKKNLIPSLGKIKEKDFTSDPAAQRLNRQLQNLVKSLAHHARASVTTSADTYLNDESGRISQLLDRLEEFFDEGFSVEQWDEFKEVFAEASIEIINQARENKGYAELTLVDRNEKLKPFYAKVRKVQDSVKDLEGTIQQRKVPIESDIDDSKAQAIMPAEKGGIKNRSQFIYDLLEEAKKLEKLTDEYQDISSIGENDAGIEAVSSLVDSLLEVVSETKTVNPNQASSDNDRTGQEAWRDKSPNPIVDQENSDLKPWQRERKEVEGKVMDLKEDLLTLHHEASKTIQALRAFKQAHPRARTKGMHEPTVIKSKGGSEEEISEISMEPTDISDVVDQEDHKSGRFARKVVMATDELRRKLDEIQNITSESKDGEAELHPRLQRQLDYIASIIDDRDYRETSNTNDQIKVDEFSKLASAVLELDRIQSDSQEILLYRPVLELRNALLDKCCDSDNLAGNNILEAEVHPEIIEELAVLKQDAELANGSDSDLAERIKVLESSLEDAELNDTQLVRLFIDSFSVKREIKDYYFESLDASFDLLDTIITKLNENHTTRKNEKKARAEKERVKAAKPPKPRQPIESSSYLDKVQKCFDDLDSEILQPVQETIREGIKQPLEELDTITSTQNCDELSFLANINKLKRSYAEIAETRNRFLHATDSFMQFGKSHRWHPNHQTHTKAVAERFEAAHKVFDQIRAAKFNINASITQQRGLLNDQAEVLTEQNRKYHRVETLKKLIKKIKTTITKHEKAAQALKEDDTQREALSTKHQDFYSTLESDLKAIATEINNLDDDLDTQEDTQRSQELLQAGLELSTKLEGAQEKIDSDREKNNLFSDQKRAATAAIKNSLGIFSTELKNFLRSNKDEIDEIAKQREMINNSSKSLRSLEKAMACVDDKYGPEAFSNKNIGRIMQRKAFELDPRLGLAYKLRVAARQAARKGYSARKSLVTLIGEIDRLAFTKKNSKYLKDAAVSGLENVHKASLERKDKDSRSSKSITELLRMMKDGEPDFHKLRELEMKLLRLEGKSDETISQKVKDDIEHILRQIVNSVARDIDQTYLARTALEGVSDYEKRYLSRNKDKSITKNERNNHASVKRAFEHAKSKIVDLLKPPEEKPRSKPETIESLFTALEKVLKNQNIREVRRITAKIAQKLIPHAERASSQSEVLSLMESMNNAITAFEMSHGGKEKPSAYQSVYQLLHKVYAKSASNLKVLLDKSIAENTQTEYLAKVTSTNEQVLDAYDSSIEENEAQSYNHILRAYQTELEAIYARQSQKTEARVYPYQTCLTFLRGVDSEKDLTKFKRQLKIWLRQTNKILPQVYDLGDLSQLETQIKALQESAKKRHGIVPGAKVGGKGDKRLVHFGGVNNVIQSTLNKISNQRREILKQAAEKRATT